MSACVRQWMTRFVVLFFFQAEDGIRDLTVTGVQTCALPIYADARPEDGALLTDRAAGDLVRDALEQRAVFGAGVGVDHAGRDFLHPQRAFAAEIGRASCRERV